MQKTNSLKTFILAILLFASCSNGIIKHEDPKNMPGFSHAAISVCEIGCDYTSIQSALDNLDQERSSTVTILDPVHTEEGIMITKDVIIEGLSYEKTIVQAHEQFAEALDTVFYIKPGSDVILRNMTIQHGNRREKPWSGGGVMNEGTLNIENCIIQKNVANDSGGIWNMGDLTISHSTITENHTNKSAPSGFDCGSGAGIFNGVGSHLTISNSTISYNHARGKGSGLHIACDSSAKLINTTVSKNESTKLGGGIHLRGSLYLINSTIAYNHANKGAGGIHIRGNFNAVNSIVAYNTTSYNTPLDCVLEQGEIPAINTNENNFIGDGTCNAEFSGDPKLDVLGYYGGPTETHTIRPGSPVIDKAKSHKCESLDQRDYTRPIIRRSSQTPCDLGAVELQSSKGIHLPVWLIKMFQ